MPGTASGREESIIARKLEQMTLTLQLKAAMLGAIAGVLMALIHVPYGPAPFLKYDPSDVVILLGAFALGPWAGILAALIKEGVYVFIHGSAEPIGIVMNFIATAAFAGTAGWYYQCRKTRSRAAIGLVLGLVVSALVMVGANLLVAPLYWGKAAGPLIGAILSFNLLKGLSNSIMVFLIYKRASALLRSADSEIAGKPFTKPMG